MKNILFWSSAVLAGSFWLVSFIGANQGGLTIFLSALAVILVSWFLYLRGSGYYFFSYLLLPLIHPAYLFFPVLFLLFHAISSSSIRQGTPILLIYLSLLIFISLFSAKTFYAYSIFTPDPLAFDTLNKKISLIPSRNLARIFHNKTDLYQDKFKANVFNSLDQNNYFFAFHPREIFENQNLSKFPYPALIPFLIGLYYLATNKHKKWLLTVFLAGTFSIALINNQDRFDLILYLPLFITIVLGLRKLFSQSAKIYIPFSLIFLYLSALELYRILTFIK